ncbi:MAG: tetratricopeptide repeat protein [Alphaproteobacteria bacterium]
MRVTSVKVLVLALATLGLMLTTAPIGYAADIGEPTKRNNVIDYHRREMELRNALKVNPNDSEAHFQLGRVYLDGGDWRAAITEFRAARRGGTNNDDLDAQLAWALYLEDEYNALFREIKPGDRKAPAESLVRLSLGLAHLHSQDLDNAERMVRDAVRLDPDSWRAGIALARLLILARKLPKAREQLEAASSIAPNQIAANRTLGYLLRAEGDTHGAIAAFSKVLEEHPTSVPALAGRIDALISENKLLEAERDMRRASKMSGHSQIKFLAALLLGREERLAEADQLLTNSSGAFDQMPVAYYLTGVVKFRRGLYETAENYLARFQRKQPNVAGAVRLRAEIALRRKDAAAAIRLLQPLVKANPSDQEAVTALAGAYLADGKPDEVIQLFQEVAEARPENVAQPEPAALLMIYGDAIGDLLEIEKLLTPKTPDAAVVITALRQGDLPKAAMVAETLAANDKDDPIIQNLLGSVRLAQKRLPDAETIFRRTLDQNRDFTPAALNLVEVLVEQNRIDEAKVLLQSLLQRSQ